MTITKGEEGGGVGGEQAPVKRKTRMAWPPARKPENLMSTAHLGTTYKGGDYHSVKLNSVGIKLCILM